MTCAPRLSTRVRCHVTLAGTTAVLGPRWLAGDVWRMRAGRSCAEKRGGRRDDPRCAGVWTSEAAERMLGSLLLSPRPARNPIQRDRSRRKCVPPTTIGAAGWCGPLLTPYLTRSRSCSHRQRRCSPRPSQRYSPRLTSSSRLARLDGRLRQRKHPIDVPSTSRRVPSRRQWRGSHRQPPLRPQHVLPGAWSSCQRGAFAAMLWRRAGSSACAARLAAITHRPREQRAHPLRTREGRQA